IFRSNEDASVIAPRWKQPAPTAAPKVVDTHLIEALDHYDSLLRTDPSLVVAWRTKAEILERLERPEEARAAREEADRREGDERIGGRSHLRPRRHERVGQWQRLHERPPRTTPHAADPSPASLVAVGDWDCRGRRPHGHRPDPRKHALHGSHRTVLHHPDRRELRRLVEPAILRAGFLGTGWEPLGPPRGRQGRDAGSRTVRVRPRPRADVPRL